MRRIERDERRIAVAPIGKLLQKRMIRRFIRLGDAKIRYRAARIGKALAEPDAPQLGGPVQRDDAHRVSDLGDDCERLPLRRRA